MLLSARQVVRRKLQNCLSCPRQCGVNRYESTGFCGVGADIRISHIGLHHGEEPPISGANGSGAIFFSGCNLRCVFCQNFQISQLYHAGTKTMSVAELAAAAIALQEAGAHNINFVSPSHMLPQITHVIKRARASGLIIPIVYNSSGYDLLSELRLLAGLVDIYLPDIKYLDNDLGRRFSGTANYADIIPAVLAEMLKQVGRLQTDANGIARKGVLVRHLVLPNQLANSKKCLRLLAGLSRDIHVSIMSQYTPCHRAAEYPEINRPLRPDEYEEIINYAFELGLHNAFVQDLSSQDNFRPDFDLPQPFATAKGEKIK
jgi:putative pyruvate formate lyase activating enzyme